MGDQDMQKLESLHGLDFRDQAIWFLNAFWVKQLAIGENLDICKQVWRLFKRAMHEDSSGKGPLDQVQMQKVLEKNVGAATATEIWKRVDINKDRKYSLIEILIFHFGIDWVELVNAEKEQWTNDKVRQEMEDAERAVKSAQKAIEESRVLEQQSREALALQKEAELEVKKGLEEIEREMKAYHDELASLEAQAADETLGQVKRGKAAHAVHTLKLTPPGNQAKLHQEVLVRRQEKSTRLANEAKQRAEDQSKECQVQFQVAMEALEEVKQKAGAGQGKLWWLSEELEEAKKYMPQKMLRKLAAKQEAELQNI